MLRSKQEKIACLIVLLFSFGLFYFGTDGFTAFTDEAARTAKLEKEQPLLPKVTLEDNAKREYTFDEFSGKYIFMTFFYTACSTVCPELEKNVAEVYYEIPEQYIGEDIIFLSVSFDPERDTPETLDRYRTYFGSDGETWRMARVNDKQELDRLLEKLGVIAIPDGQGDFQHNVAFYIINKEGYLTDVLNFNDTKGATEKLMSLLQEEAGGTS